MVGRHQNAFVTGTSAHGSQCIHVLSTRDARNAVQRDGRNTTSRQTAHHVMVDGRCRMDECDEQLASVHHVHLVLLQFLIEERFLHLQNHLGTVVDLLRVVHQFGTNLHISLVVIKRTFTCRTLY